MISSINEFYEFAQWLKTQPNYTINDTRSLATVIEKFVDDTSKKIDEQERDLANIENEIY